MAQHHLWEAYVPTIPEKVGGPILPYASHKCRNRAGSGSLFSASRVVPGLSLFFSLDIYFYIHRTNLTAVENVMAARLAAGLHAIK